MELIHMTLRCSHIAGLMAFLYFLQPARAGQKIEYSVPSSQAAAPNPAQEQRDAALFPNQPKMNFGANPDFEFMPAPSVVIVAPTRKRDSIFDKKDDKTDDRSGPLKEKDKESDNQAKKWTPEKYLDPNSEEARRLKDAGHLSSVELSRPQNIKDDPHDLTSKPRLSGDYNSGRRDTRDRESSWSQDFKSGRTQTDWGRPNDGKSIFDRPNSMSPVGTPGSSTDPLRGLAWPSASVHSAGAAAAGRGDHFMDKPNFSVPGYGDSSYHANLPTTRDAKAPSQGSGYFQQGTYAPHAPPPKHNAPAILEFPRRPGDVFR